ncbi:MAG TPA: ATP-binding protein [Anaerolineaceae bacterium]|nr:ATP-binding protein [Anaerolineaceae bacterium]
MEAVLLIGIPASGKSTFYQTYFAGTHVRINLDTLKTRSREDALLKACLESHRPFVVDNTNVQVRERRKYIQAAQLAGYRVIGYYFTTNLKEALERNLQRSGKERIPPHGVIARYRILEPPRLAEGFDELFEVQITENGGYEVKKVHKAPS